jgi:hypothetical protein
MGDRKRRQCDLMNPMINRQDACSPVKNVVFPVVTRNFAVLAQICSHTFVKILLDLCQVGEIFYPSNSDDPSTSKSNATAKTRSESSARHSAIQ